MCIRDSVNSYQTNLVCYIIIERQLVNFYLVEDVPVPADVVVPDSAEGQT